MGKSGNCFDRKVRDDEELSSICLQEIHISVLFLVVVVVK